VKASIYATYSGGLVDRQADAVFKVDKTAYVMVAHLSGDGRVEVLFPEDGRESGYLKGGKWYRTPRFSAYYDAVPQLYSFTPVRTRTLSARMDSYDGLGYGFVFIVASRYPLRFDRISDLGLWDDLELDNYRYLSDPREGIRLLVEKLTDGKSYALKFATSTTSSSLSTALDARRDCALLSSYSFVPYSAIDYAFSAYNPLGGYTRFGSPCGYSQYSLAFGYGYYNQYGRGYAVTAPLPNIPVTPKRGPSLSPRRPFGGSGPARGASAFNALPSGAANAAPAPRTRWALSPRGYGGGGDFMGRSTPRSPSSGARSDAGASGRTTRSSDGQRSSPRAQPSSSPRDTRSAPPPRPSSPAPAATKSSTKQQ